MRKLFGADEIARRVEELGGEIARALPPRFLLVALLKGSFVFAADLVRALDRAGARPRVAFMQVASYGAGKTSRGEVRLIGGVPAEVPGQPVLLLDDILDTGRSLAFARDRILARGAARVWTCVLVDKPSRREVPLACDFVGFRVDDLFIVGYGIDHAEDYRHLPDIGTVD